MQEITYKLGTPSNFSDEELTIFLALLKQQGKVQNPTLFRIKQCKILCVCKVNNQMTSIGAIKKPTIRDFDVDKADLARLGDDFLNELGYCFTLSGFTGQGFSSTITKMLLDKMADQNIMASTELRDSNAMKSILERKGFKLYGKPWKSNIHEGTVGLYLKFVK